MNNWRNTKKGKGILRVLVLILCICMVFSGNPDILTMVPVYAASVHEAENGGQDASEGEEQPVSGNGQMAADPAAGEKADASVAEGIAAEPVISAWHFGEEDIFPAGALFYEAGTYSLILSGGSEEIQIPVEEITDMCLEA